MSLPTDEEKLLVLQNDLWKLVNTHIGGQGQSSEVLSTSGMMLKVALQLYTILMSDNEIEKTLDHIKLTIPDLRDKMENLLGERVLH